VKVIGEGERTRLGLAWALACGLPFSDNVNNHGYDR
jgi:hypothetical protein